MRLRFSAMVAVCLACVFFTVSCGADAGAGTARAADAPRSLKYVPVTGWRIVGTGVRGRSVKVRPTRGGLPCVVYRARARETQARVRVVIEQSLDRCGDVVNAVYAAPPILTARLRHALKGREVVGGRVRESAIFNIEATSDETFVVPSVLGLNVTQARLAARAWNLELDVGATPGNYVVSQSPAPGQPGFRPPRLAVTLSQ